MENEIIVRIAKGDDGFVIARAVGYPGVITFGRSEEEVMREIQIVWNGMAQIDAIKHMGNPKHPIYKGHTTEKRFRLQA
ncbi:type II toxin-antitoxin system HicB family antitoxin [Spirosoma sp.]|uniref:type II toxin-antitoxin system HicB family antitoxin n=1 Tax=Spirosoma sp. TaxID=1899569 RepID=UPI003B3A39D9